MTHAVRIMIIDDEKEIQRFLKVALTQKGYEVIQAESAHLALKMVANKPPDLVILDLGLPDMDGKDVLSKLREWSTIPVIILSARNQEAEKVAALECGADDYLTKPFGAAELLARVHASLRRANRLNTGSNEIYKYNGLEIDTERRLVKLNGCDLRLTPTEYKLLTTLAQQAGKVITQSTLINAVWGKNSQGNSQYLRIYIQHLRDKLGDDPLSPQFIFTDPGVGYRLLKN